MAAGAPLIAWLGELDRGAASIAGGKGAGLNDMVRAGLSVPPGFVVCAEAFRSILAQADLKQQIVLALSTINVEHTQQLEAAARFIQELIVGRPLPDELRAAIEAAYVRLCSDQAWVPVAVRSSAVAEDSRTASFAGQQDTYLNVVGTEALVQRVQACWASFFGPRAIFYRRQKGAIDDTAMAVVVQRMVMPQKSGVLFTLDPVQRRRDRIIVEATWGLGEAVVSGKVTPDHYALARDGSVLNAFVPRKAIAIVHDDRHGGTREVVLDEAQSRARVLDADELRRLAELGAALEAYFGTPQDVEWAIENGTIYLLQSRPITTV